jgi:hypothetical protein
MTDRFHAELSVDMNKWVKRKDTEISEFMEYWDDNNSESGYLVRREDDHIILKERLSELELKNSELASALKEEKLQHKILQEASPEILATLCGEDYQATKQSWLNDVGIWQKKYNDLERKYNQLKVESSLSELYFKQFEERNIKLTAKNDALERELCGCEARASTVTTELNELRRQNKD